MTDQEIRNLLARKSENANLDYKEGFACIKDNRDKKSEVALGGWTFPHMDNKHSGPFSRGFQSVTIWDRFCEGYRLYQSGLFIWNRSYWEDETDRRSKKGNRALSVIPIVYSFTEYLLFLKRMYEVITPEGTIHVRVALHGCKNRELAALDSDIFLWEGHISGVDDIPIKEDIRIVELQASWQEIARRMVMHVFHVFNWLDAGDSLIAGWQEKLLKRKL